MTIALRVGPGKGRVVRMVMQEQDYFRRSRDVARDMVAEFAGSDVGLDVSRGCLKPRRIFSAEVRKALREGCEKTRQAAMRSPESLPGRDVACGQCENCIIRWKREWALRIALEKLECEAAGGVVYFVTLTYDEKHHPKISEVLDAEGRVAAKFVDEFQRFLKRLQWHRLRTREDRKRFGPHQIRYFATAEIGDKGERAKRGGNFHWHALLYCNRAIFDEGEFEIARRERVAAGLQVVSGRQYLREWPNGFVRVQNADIGVAYYLTKYTVKGGLRMRQTLASRRPGLGKSGVKRRAREALRQEPISEFRRVMRHGHERLEKIVREPIPEGPQLAVVRRGDEPRKEVVRGEFGKVLWELPQTLAVDGRSRKGEPMRLNLPLSEYAKKWFVEEWIAGGGLVDVVFDEKEADVKSHVRMQVGLRPREGRPWAVAKERPKTLDQRAQDALQAASWAKALSGTIAA